MTLMTLGVRVIYAYGRINLTWSPSSQQRGVVPGLLRLPCQARVVSVSYHPSLFSNVEQAFRTPMARREQTLLSHTETGQVKTQSLQVISGPSPAG